MFFRPGLHLLILAIMLGSACKRSPQRPVRRIAVVPFENLSGDMKLDWWGAISPFVVVSQTGNVQGLVTVVAGAERDVTALRANFVLAGYYTVTGGEIRVRSVLRDVASSRTVRRLDISGPPAGALQRVSAFLSGKPVPSAALNVAALEQFGRSLLARDPAEKRALLEQALKADPKHAFAAASLAQMQSAAGDREAARQTLVNALEGRPESWERAQLKQWKARLENDRDGLLSAMREAVAVSPNDADLARQLAEACVERRRYPEAIVWLKKAVQLEPDQTAFWNLLAYAQAYARDFDGAFSSTGRYRALAPADPNADDSSGEVAWMAGRFADAEKYFLEAQKKQPLFLGGLEFSKAAFSRFLGGDVGGADAIFHRYLESRRAINDATAPLRQAQWLYLTGRHKKAHEMAAAVKGDGELAARAGTLRAVWLLQEGDRAQAFEIARSAAALPRAGQAASAAALMAFIAQPAASPGEWESRANRVLAPQARRLALLYALLLNKHYSEAAKLLSAAFSESSPANSDEIRMLLAQTKLMTGDNKAAAALLENYPLPPQPGESIFATLYFPAFLDWRKAAGPAVARAFLPAGPGLLSVHAAYFCTRQPGKAVRSFAIPASVIPVPSTSNHFNFPSPTSVSTAASSSRSHLYRHNFSICRSALKALSPAAVMAVCPRSRSNNATRLES